MKLSFSISSNSKSSSKPNPIKPSPSHSHTFHNSSSSSPTHQDPSNSKQFQFLTEFDPSKPPDNTKPVIIPPIQNDWRPLKKMKNLTLPITHPNAPQSLQFEQDNTTSSSPTEPDIAYGLNLRHTSTKTNHNGHTNPQDDADAVADADAEENNNRVRHAPVETVLLQKFKDDLKRLPEDQGFDEFKDVPVEGFGASLLAGYGWSEGMGIGKNAKEDVKVVQYERRTAKEGLGFVADDIRSSKSKNKEKKPKENGVGDGGIGKSVRIVEGRDAGLKGSVVKRIGDDCLVLKLSRSGEEVKVKIDDVAELGSVEEERCLRKLKELKIQQQPQQRRTDKDKGLRNKRGRDEGRREERRVEVNGGDHRRKEEQEKGKKQVPWLTSHIRVRVISRDFKGGRLYLKKGEVLDVVGPSTCDISIDESKEIIQGVSQDLLETVIPRRGGLVLVLYGKYKGAYGSLVERDLDREIGTVKDADSHELLNVRLEQIAEYIGDPSLLGH